MNPTRKIAVIVGVLFLLGYVGIFLGSAFYAPFLEAPDFLSDIYPNRTQVVTGMLIELINDVAVIGIVVMLFPIFKIHSERMALGLVAFRFMEAALLVVSKVNVLSLIPLSQEYIAAGAPDGSYFQALSASTLAGRYWANQMSTVFFILGALIFYLVLYQSKLLPRFISVYGLIAVVALAAANLLGVPDPTQGFQPATILYLLMFVSELLVAVWLIAKGFNPSAAASLSTKKL
jgi:hypothetical protein